MTLFAKQTIVALLDNDSGAHIHRHSTVLGHISLGNGEYHSPLDRSTTGLGRIFKSLCDHPAAASVGWDVILCGFSLIVWASVRGLKITKITGNAGLDRTLHLEKANVNGASKNSSNQSPLKAATRFDAGHVGKDSSGSARRRRVASKSVNEDNMSLDKGCNGEGEMPENLESGAVSSALFALGGLGAIASGVLGAETEGL
jgi:hypothetical protein